MQTSSLRINRPHLEGVLGPLSPADDDLVRVAFARVDGVLLELAAYFGRERAGWEGTGLELRWAPSGQLAIGSHVETALDSGRCVAFELELRPSWYFGERAATLSWEVSTSIAADCQHATDHGHMECVHDVTVHADTMHAAVEALETAATALLHTAKTRTLEHWLLLASDGRHVPSTKSSCRLHLVADLASSRFADRLASDFAGDGHRVTRTTLERFPVADPLPALLGRLAPAGGVAVVAVSPESANRTWVLAELRLANLYPRVLLAVPSVEDLAGWAADDPRLILPGTGLPRHLP